MAGCLAGWLGLACCSVWFVCLLAYACLLVSLFVYLICLSSLHLPHKLANWPSWLSVAGSLAGSLPACLPACRHVRPVPFVCLCMCVCVCVSCLVGVVDLVFIGPPWPQESDHSSESEDSVDPMLERDIGREKAKGRGGGLDPFLLAP